MKGGWHRSAPPPRDTCPVTPAHDEKCEQSRSERDKETKSEREKEKYVASAPCTGWNV